MDRCCFSHRRWVSVEDVILDNSAACLESPSNDAVRKWAIGEDAHQIGDHRRTLVGTKTAAHDVAKRANDAVQLGSAQSKGTAQLHFCTSTGSRLANLGPGFADNWAAIQLHPGPTELKFEVTGACDLACGFCHRRGVSERSGTMSLETFLGGLHAAVRTGIRSVRLTGGEPFLHGNLRQLAEAAQGMDLEVVVNTNATAVSIASMLALADVIDCFKISLPGFDQDSTRLATGSSLAWQRKVESIGELIAHGCRIEVLTVMTSVNISHFEQFLELLDPLKRVRWLPLRPEPTPEDPRPIDHSQLLQVVGKIETARSLGSRWTDLQLNLAVPFCALEDPELARRVFRGRLGCGPIDSLTMTASGELISCYSRRAPIQSGEDMAATWRRTLEQDFEQLPLQCQQCALGWRCLGGCRCEWALRSTAEGRFDYLADPLRAREWCS